ncbi:hypothetical protein Tco_0542006 [Tanacetum coccineum]
MQKSFLPHFVKQDDDTFYVTGYDNDGLECGGYNVVRKSPGRIVTRVWPYPDYPQATITKFDGVTNLKKRQREMTLDEKANDRMEHICLWPSHTEHFGERNDTFYKRYWKMISRTHSSIQCLLDKEKSNPAAPIKLSGIIRFMTIDACSMLLMQVVGLYGSKL